MRILAFVFLGGCGVVRGFGGPELELEDQAAGEPESDSDPVEPAAGTVEAACYDTGFVERGVSATGADGAVQIADLGYTANCCAEWSASVAVTGDFSLSVAYADAGEECDCACPWSLHYTISPLQSGDWTIDVAGETVTATVP
jgi:hypothetical protein